MIAMATFTAGTNRNDDVLGEYSIVCLSHFKWLLKLMQRPHQFMLRLSAHRKVLFVYPVSIKNLVNRAFGRKTSKNCYINENLYVYYPYLLPSLRNRFFLSNWLNHHLLAFQINRRMKKLGFKKVISWYYFPVFSHLTANLRSDFMVYDCMDNYSEFIGETQDTARKELELLDHADIVFTGGWNLLGVRKERNPNIFCFPCGVDIPHFNKALSGEGPLPPEVEGIKHPVLGYWGTLDEKADLPLLKYLSEKEPDWSIVLIGPLWKRMPGMDEVLDLPNIHHLGSKLYDEIPDYARAFDVCLIPYQINELTKFMNPTKLLEYIATGRPVVSTPLPDVINGYKDWVYIGYGNENFHEKVKEALERENDQERSRRMKLLEGKTWEGTVERMLDKIRIQMGKGESRQGPDR